MANINPTPPNKTTKLVIQSQQKDDLAWRRIVKYLAQNERTVEEEYLLIEKKESKLPSILRLYIEIYINYNLQLERFNQNNNQLNGKSN